MKDNSFQSDHRQIDRFIVDKLQYRIFGKAQLRTASIVSFVAVANIGNSKRDCVYKENAEGVLHFFYTHK